MDAKRKNDFTQGSVAASILKLAAPMTLALLINVLYSVVDRMYIGHIEGIGRLALTGIGLAFPITSIISAFQQICSTGGAPLCSIARGEQNDEKAERILGTSFTLLLIFGVVLTVLGLSFKEPVLRLVGAGDETFVYADGYLGIYLLGTVFVMLGLGLNAFINAQGFARTGMLTVLLGAVVNIALDPLFIFVFKLDVRGAAIATVIAQGCSTVWALGFLLSRKAVVRLRLRYMRPDWGIVKKTVALGMSGFIAAVTNSAVSIVYNSTLASLDGEIYITSMTVINSLREVTFMPVSGIASGAQPVIGYNYGAKRYGRVRSGIKVLTVFCIVYSVVMLILFEAAPELLIRIFNSDPELLAVGPWTVRVTFCMFVFMALQMAGQNVFRCLGKAKQAVFFSLLRKAFLVIPLVLLLPGVFGLGVKGVFYAEPISDILGGVACYGTMLLTVWRRLKAEERLEAAK